MTQEHLVESTARSRLRSLRASRGWTIDELSQRCHLSSSTISRLETGQRRLALDHLVTLARALETPVDEILAGGEEEDVVIRPATDRGNGSTFWLLSRRDDPSGRIVAKMRVPAGSRDGELRVHPGRDWFYVLSGTVRLQLGERDLLVRAGEAADFNTMTPHRMTGYRAPAEVVTIFDKQGEQTHLR